MLPISFVKFLRSHWVRTFFGFLLLAVLIWFCGPLIAIGQIHPFDSEIARLITIGVLLLLWLLVNILTVMNHNKRDRALTAVVTEPDKDAQTEENAWRQARPAAAV